MSKWLPWLNCTPEQKLALRNIFLRFGIDPANRDIRASVLDIERWYNLTSYTYRESINNFREYLTGNLYHGYDGISDEDAAEEKSDGLLEYSILMFLATFSEDIKIAIRNCFLTTDRSNDERYDPIRDHAANTRLAYLPKGITDFNPEDKQFEEEISARIQREIIKENATDPSLDNAQDKTITVKVFTNPPTSDFKYMQIYFNKKSRQTVRRLIYKLIRETITYFNLAETIADETDKTCFESVYNAFFNPGEEVDYAAIIEIINNYITEKLAYAEANLVETFAEHKKHMMNQERKANLDRNLQRAKENYDDNVQRFAELKAAYLQAKHAVDTFSEVEFDAIEVFLRKIKEHPRTKLFAKINNDCLQFLIEEPIIHTEPEVWARVLTNPTSDVNYAISRFASNNYGEYDTNYEILKVAIQRLIKELFVDQKIRIYTAALLGLRADRSDFSIEKYCLPDNTYMPHPHIGSNNLTCWNEALREISRQILDNDGDTAFLQLTYALQQMTASDNIVSRKFTELILMPDYSNIAVYLRKGETERITFKTIIKEFIEDETNKINAIIDSESEGSAE